jgi:hypothetical protein
LCSRGGGETKCPFLQQKKEFQDQPQEYEQLQHDQKAVETGERKAVVEDSGRENGIGSDFIKQVQKKPSILLRNAPADHKKGVREPLQQSQSDKAEEVSHPVLK